MPAKPLTPDQLADAKRLREAFAQAQQETGLTQERLAEMCGWKTQGAVSQYLRGKIPLNITALHKFADVLHAQPYEISPNLAATAQGFTKRYSKTGTSVVTPGKSRMTEGGGAVSASEIAQLILDYERCAPDARESVLELAATGATLSANADARARK